MAQAKLGMGLSVGGIWRRLLRNEQGATAVEYGLIVALMVLAMLVGMQAFADETTSMWTEVSSGVAEAMH
ncbi:MAG: Flp family type IVb pilin [Bradyrhizobium sp.]|nr:Flp family type IVb pilin [Bradyrhizobium sp.]